MGARHQRTGDEWGIEMSKSITAADVLAAIMAGDCKVHVRSHRTGRELTFIVGKLTGKCRNVSVKGGRGGLCTLLDSGECWLPAA